MALGSTQSLTEMSTGLFPGGKGGRCVRLTTLPTSCAFVMKSGNLNYLEPSGPLQACNGNALLCFALLIRAVLSYTHFTKTYTSIHLTTLIYTSLHFSHGCTALAGLGLVVEVSGSHSDTTLGGTPLDEWSARSRDLYLTTHKLTRDRHASPQRDSNPQSQKREAVDLRLRPCDHWDQHLKWLRDGNCR